MTLVAASPVGIGERERGNGKGRKGRGRESGPRPERKLEANLDRKKKAKGMHTANAQNNRLCELDPGTGQFHNLLPKVLADSALLSSDDKRRLISRVYRLCVTLPRSHESLFHPHPKQEGNGPIDWHAIRAKIIDIFRQSLNIQD